MLNSQLRWLIDTDKDDEGMRVIADLHGGDIDDPVAKAEFNEIKEKVLFEVSGVYDVADLLLSIYLFHLAPIWRGSIICHDVEKI